MVGIFNLIFGSIIIIVLLALATIVGGILTILSVPFFIGLIIYAIVKKVFGTEETDDAG